MERYRTAWLDQSLQPYQCHLMSASLDLCAARSTRRRPDFLTPLEEMLFINPENKHSLLQLLWQTKPLFSLWSQLKQQSFADWTKTRNATVVMPRQKFHSARIISSLGISNSFSTMWLGLQPARYETYKPLFCGVHISFVSVKLGKTIWIFFPLKFIL